VGFLAFLAVIPLAILGSLGPRPLYVWRLSTDTDGPRSFAGLWGLVALSLAVWLAVLPFTQPAQQRRTAVDRAIARGEYDRAAALLREWPEASFPLTWRPGPPSVNRMTALAALVAMIEMRKQDLPAWAADYYRERQWDLLRSHGINPFATEEHLRAFVEDPEIGAWLDAPLAADASSLEQWNHERYREIRQMYAPPERLPENKDPVREPE
jgi:hypothetical protein